MRRFDQKLLLSVLICSLPLAACQEQTAKNKKIEPAHVEYAAGSAAEITLTEDAVNLIDLQMSVVVRATGSEGEFTAQNVVPYSALMYGPNGETWVYVSPEPNKFVRHRVEVDRIEGDAVLLKSGPEKDTMVTTVGATELYGAETGSQ